MHAKTASWRWLSVAAVAVVVASLQIATAPPAAALPALQLVIEDTGPDEETWKLAEASCPPGKVVVGGGGEIRGNDSRTTILTGLEPRAAVGTKPAGFIAYGAALATVGSWSIVAYALCVDAAAMQPYKINVTPSPTTDSVFKDGKSPCPPGMVAYSAGGMAPNPYGGFGLQMVRTSGPLDIARATVRATSNPVEPWKMTTIAVCGPKKDGIAAQSELVTGPLGSLPCPPGQQIHGAGGGLGLADGGRNWLRNLHPIQHDPPRTMKIQMTLLGPSYQMSTSATCASQTP